MIVRRTIAALVLLTPIIAISADAQVGRPGLASQGAATQNELIGQRVLLHLELQIGNVDQRYTDSLLSRRRGASVPQTRSSAWQNTSPATVA